VTDGTVLGRDPTTGRGIAVRHEAGKIVAIDAVPANDHPYLAAGLVDLQVNGYGGLDLNDDAVTPDRVFNLAGKLALAGTTTFLPTLITASREQLLKRLSVIAEARRQHPLIAHMVPGIHVEGPAISPEDGPRGAHPLAHVRPPSLDEFAAWQTASGGLVRLITLAPEYAEAVAYIRAVTKAGVLVALGHTAATPEQIHAAAEAGARLSTHLGNGAAAMLARHPNFIWAQLADDRLDATFIADGHHLSADTFKAMLRAKGLNRSVLVSDSVALAGMPAGLYHQAIGGAVEVSASGRIGVAGTPYLAGAGLPLSANMALAVQLGELSLAEALRLATVNPGRFAGDRGRLEIGADADLISFDWQPGADRLEIRETWILGVQVER